MEITTLTDLQTGTPLTAEFGLSFLIRDGEEEYLFDTGAGEALAANLNILGIKADTLKKVILSHGHYDHTGGLRFLQPEEIRCCPGICREHFSRHDTGEMHRITMPAAAQNVLDHTKVHWVRDFQAISSRLFLTGPIPRVSGEDCGGDFYHDEQCREKDFVPEEQALLSTDGTLITGCCHAGIINTILHCRKHHPEIRIRKIAGGLHLLHADQARLEKTASFIRECGVRELYLLHCTGENAAAFLRAALPECTVSTLTLGTAFTL